MKRKKLHSQVLVISFVSLFTDIASEMLYPVTPIFMSTILGASMTIIGIMEGIAEVIAGFLKGYFGKISDNIRKRSIFVTIGYSLSAISKPLPGIFPNVPVVFSARILDRLGKGIRTAPRDALLSTYSENNSGAVFGFHRAMDTLGAALGPAFALLLLFLYPGNYRLIFLVAFFPSLIAVTFTFFVKDRFVSKSKSIKISYSDFLSHSPKQYKILLTLFTIFSFANSSDTFLILRSRQISNSETIAILSYIFYNIIYAISSYPLGMLSDKFSKRNIFAFGMLMYSLVYFGFGFSSNIILIFIFFILYGLYAASTEGITKAWIADLISDEERGTAIGLFTMLSSFAIMGGTFFAGILWDNFGSQIPFLFSGIVALLIFISVLILQFRKMI